MIGAQSPRISIQPKRKSSDGDDAGLLFSAYAYKLDEWQAATLACWLGKDAAGQYNVMSAGLSVPRQNGKNSCLEAREFFGLIVNGSTMGIIPAQAHTGSDEHAIDLVAHEGDRSPVSYRKAVEASE